jgi:hypothetical protein
MSADDFGDFKVPPSLVANVLRRRPSRSRERCGSRRAKVNVLVGLVAEADGLHQQNLIAM